MKNTIIIVLNLQPHLYRNFGLPDTQCHCAQRFLKSANVSACLTPRCALSWPCHLASCAPKTTWMKNVCEVERHKMLSSKQARLKTR